MFMLRLSRLGMSSDDSVFMSMLHVVVVVVDVVVETSENYASLSASSVHGLNMKPRLGALSSETMSINYLP